MRKAHCGFSLIEAMISVLVLSVGLLGLAQLQARLSMASLQLQASTQARVLGASGIEHALMLETGAANAADEASAVVVTPATRFETTTELTRTERLIATQLRVRWEDPAGKHEVHLETLANAETDAIASRLLLPSY
ncbi:MAG: prepilin-type N-terminal cleavage/methylation domain-containing protein [Thiogranum sp.]|nr:prepilin-type N-terminal cleavage/methylation domain-containing protein [Thiogranum sp.]